MLRTPLAALGLSSRSRQRRYYPMLERLETRDTPASLPTGFSEAIVASGLNGPTALELLPDGRILVAEQGGTLRVVAGGRLQAAPALQLAVNSEGERGLLGVTSDPDFASNRFIYVYYTTAAAPIHNRVSRFTLAGNQVQAGSEVVLMDLEPLAATVHNGGAIHFGRDGKLYVGVGENGRPDAAQSLSNRLGKILRLNSDGSIPSDNPFFGQASGANRAIWALGLRNPFTFAVQPGTGRIFINDVGAGSFEEIDEGAAGANFGWPETEGPTRDPRFRGPLFAYQHGSGTERGNAIVGAAFYNPRRPLFPSDHVGDYYFGDLTSGWIRRYDVRTGRVALFATGIESLVDIRVSSGGSLFYLARGGASGGVLARVDFRRPDLRWLGQGLYVRSRIRTGIPFRLTRIFTVGGASVRSSFTISYFASRDTRFGNRDDVFVGRETIRAASAGRVNRALTPELRLRRGGRHYFFAVLDSTRRILETSDANNVARTRVAIGVS